MNLFFKKLLVSLILISYFAACKKGEDDPLISLRTRKARVVGNWHVKSGKTVDKIKDANNERITETVYTRNDYTMQETITSNTSGGNSSQISSYFNGDFEYKMDFKNNGTVEFTETTDSNTIVRTGTWNFTGGIGAAKNKEQMVVHYTAINIVSGGSVIYTGNETNITFTIKELRNRKMVIYSDYSYENSNSISGTYHEEYTLEQ